MQQAQSFPRQFHPPPLTLLPQEQSTSQLAVLTSHPAFTNDRNHHHSSPVTKWSVKWRWWKWSFRRCRCRHRNRNSRTHGRRSRSILLYPSSSTDRLPKTMGRVVQFRFLTRKSQSSVRNGPTSRTRNGPKERKCRISGR
jgi:hypothetical protein